MELALPPYVGKHALRRLQKWFTSTGLLTLAIGIGANTAIFTLVRAVS